MKRVFAQKLPPSAVLVVGDLGLDLSERAPSSVHDLTADELAEAIDTFIRVNQNVIHASYAVNLPKSGGLVISHTTEDQEATALAHRLFGPDVQIESVVIDGLLVPSFADGQGAASRTRPLPMIAVGLALLAATVVVWRRLSRHTLSA